MERGIVLQRVKRILYIAIPLMIQGLVFQLQSLTDKVFLGRLDTRYVSAAGAAQLPYHTTIDSFGAICTGLAILVATNYGARNYNKIMSYVKSSFFYNFLIGMVLFLLWEFGAEGILRFFQIDEAILPYSVLYVRICAGFLFFAGMDSALQAMLFGMGKTRVIMYVGICKVAVNIVLSWVLIFGKLGFPAMNVTGAAIGTLAANMLSFFILLIYVFLFDENRRELRKWNRDWRKVAPFIEMLRLGIPVCMEYLLWNFTNLLLVRFINGFGYVDMAIYTLVFGCQSIIFVAIEGIAKGMMTLMGQSRGAGDEKEVHAIFHTSLILNFLVVAVIASSFFWMPEAILRIFSKDPAVIQGGAGFLMFMGVICFSQSLNVISGNGIRAHGNTKWMLFTQVIGSVLVITISYTLICVFQMKMSAIYITLFVDETIRGILNLIYLSRRSTISD